MVYGYKPAMQAQMLFSEPLENLHGWQEKITYGSMTKKIIYVSI